MQQINLPSGNQTSLRKHLDLVMRSRYRFLIALVSVRGDHPSPVAAIKSYGHSLLTPLDRNALGIPETVM